MGKVEKVVVLGVLFLIAVILVVSLTVDDPLDKAKVAIPGAAPVEKTAGPESKTPVAKGTEVAQGAGAATTVAPATTQATPSTLLSANVATEPPSAPARAADALTMPAGTMLKTGAGLQDSFMPDMKFYTWQSGDTFRSVAAKYYGDATKVTMLRRVNEDRYDVAPGEKIFVPVFDLDAAPETAALANASQPAAAPATTAAAAKPAPTTASGARVHVVKEGESLWKIAKQELGSGARWNEIYDANRDVLSSPEALHTGLKLKIP